MSNISSDIREDGHLRVLEPRVTLDWVFDLHPETIGLRDQEIDVHYIQPASSDGLLHCHESDESRFVKRVRCWENHSYVSLSTVAFVVTQECRHCLKQYYEIYKSAGELSASPWLEWNNSRL